jgi:hypothetical protein
MLAVCENERTPARWRLRLPNGIRPSCPNGRHGRAGSPAAAPGFTGNDGEHGGGHALLTFAAAGIFDFLSGAKP